MGWNLRVMMIWLQKSWKRKYALKSDLLKENYAWFFEYFARSYSLKACNICSGVFSLILGFPWNSVGKASACNAGNLVLILGSGWSAGEGNGYPLQYSCLENPMDRGAWRATVHGITGVGRDLALSFFLSLILVIGKTIVLAFCCSYSFSNGLCWICYNIASASDQELNPYLLHLKVKS